MSNSTPYTPATEPVTIDGSEFVPALVAIDMQNDFVSGSLAVPGAEAIIPIVNALIDHPGFKFKVATRDFHPDNHVSFAQTHNKPVLSKAIIFHPEDKDKLMGLEQVLWPVHCVANTEGAEFVPGLIKDKFDHIVHKGTHPDIESYSAFKDIWGKHTSELPEMLKEKKITDVFYVGLAGDYCVKYTAIDSVSFGFRSWVVVDGVKSISSDCVAWDKMATEGVKFTTSKDVLTRLGQVN
ncbi:pyrazinamidase/nicotinamidase [Coprinopsis cinerea okayama7|uniref:nicotinamidase n=1 Tax=Coprinopsis cinerea (strain Okayama-7 / 130 / ATCC MYA-4618 / FGSC 9003) TaxID=240176 RepID=A8N318_COPC7|nr:pyrazinamidase/nicotinamidase [Coprinopsis cinerea okayama7\|eukprot:XP_001829253.1 pyrazinamidase/nicotinamidase [Coprinopsis cinerea okayama7\